MQNNNNNQNNNNQENSKKDNLFIKVLLGIAVLCIIGYIINTCIFIWQMENNPYKPIVTSKGEYFSKEDFRNKMEKRISNLEYNISTSGDLIISIEKRNTKDKVEGYDYKKGNDYIIQTIPANNLGTLNQLKNSGYFKLKKTKNGFEIISKDNISPIFNDVLEASKYYTNEKSADKIYIWMKKDIFQQYYFDPEFDPEGEYYEFVDEKHIIKKTKSNDEAKQYLDNLKKEYIKHFGSKNN